jgi:hypothetical protein
MKIILLIILIIIVFIIVSLFRILNTKLTDLKLIHVLIAMLFYKFVKSEKKTYFIKSGELVKIGVAGNVEKRFRQILTSNPDAEIYGIVNQNIEKILHKQFSKYQYKREWFYFQPIKNMINKLLTQYK